MLTISEQTKAFMPIIPQPQVEDGNTKVATYASGFRDLTGREVVPPSGHEVAFIKDWNLWVFIPENWEVQNGDAA